MSFGSGREGPIRKFLKGSGPLRDTLRGTGLLGQTLGTRVTGELGFVLDLIDTAEGSIESSEFRLKNGNLPEAVSELEKAVFNLNDAAEFIRTHPEFSKQRERGLTRIKELIAR